MIGNDWDDILKEEFKAPYFRDLRAFVKERRTAGVPVFPEPEQLFEALKLTPYRDVKVLILGQDPYHGFGQAEGLAFSVNEKVKIPPSLRNIFQELGDDLGLFTPKHGSLRGWASEGVLLLNAILTVEKGLPSSHKGKGWEQFTDAVVKKLNEKEEPVVFILWGRYAQEKVGVVDTSRHLVLKSPHPSPFSAHFGFFGSRPFSKANQYLIDKNRGGIKWVESILN